MALAHPHALPLAQPDHDSETLPDGISSASAMAHSPVAVDWDEMALYEDDSRAPKKPRKGCRPNHYRVYSSPSDTPKLDYGLETLVSAHDRGSFSLLLTLTFVVPTSG